MAAESKQSSVRQTAPSRSLDNRWEQLHAKLQAAALILRNQGTLTSRPAGKQTVWSVRYYERTSEGRRVQRAIYVGADPALVQRAQNYLESLQAEAADAERIGVAIQLLEAIERAAGLGRVWRPKRVWG